MKSIKLIKAKVKSLAEIFQSLDIKFAYVNKEFKEVSIPAKCRDFLGDCIWSKKTGKPVSIYGFTYDYVESPFDDCRFSLKFPNAESMNNFIANLPYLHEKEKQAKVKRSKIFTTDDKSTLVIEGANWWVKSIWKVSLYTFYLKVMSYKSVADVKSPEDGYVKYLTPEIEAKLLAKIKTVDENIADNINEAHNYQGFVSLIKGNYLIAKVNHQLVFGK